MNNAQQVAGNQMFGANQLLQAGNLQAGFDQTALDANIARHDYGQNAQAQHLARYTDAVFGAPMGSTSTTSQSGGGK
jgi:2-hydroxychromene-2-carboxylate isomerase